MPHRLAWLLALGLLGGCATPVRVAMPDVAAASRITHAPCQDEADWNEATTPRRIFGDTWYMGSCGITAVLIASPQGHILIDGATEQAAAGIARSIEATGARLRDVRLILNTHEHYDHAGGIAALQAMTGARVLARSAALPVLRSGRSTRADAQFAELKAFAPTPDAQPLTDGALVRLGDLAVQTYATPGHAPGGTSFSWRACEGGQCKQIVYADSVSAIADAVYHYRDDPAHVARFRRSMAVLAAVTPCDILLTPHPGSSHLWPRLRGEQPMVTPDACRDYAAMGIDNLDTRLRKEAQGATP